MRNPQSAFTAVTRDNLSRRRHIVVLLCAILEAVLIPTPFYGAITEDLQLYSDVALYHVPLDCEVGAVGRCTSALVFPSTESCLEPPLSLGVSFGKDLLVLVINLLLMRLTAKTDAPSISLSRSWRKVWRRPSKR